MSGAPDRFGCADARQVIHARLDRGMIDADRQARLEDHLAGCSECRVFKDDMTSILKGLRALPEPTLPDDVLDRVLGQAVQGVAPKRRWPYPVAVAVAVAAVLVLTLGGPWLRQATTPAGPTQAELQQASREARRVLTLTSRAMRHAGKRAVDNVLADDVSGALRRVPIRWPGEHEVERRGS